MAPRPCIVCASTQATAFASKGRFAIQSCGGCGLRFLDPQPNAADLEALYGRAYFARAEAGDPGYDDYMVELDNHRAMFDDRVRLLPSPFGERRLLDVGAAVGVFVERARLNGWDATGIEPSSWAAEYARTELCQPVITGTTSSLDLSPASVDAITMWEVIEHLPDPTNVLAEIRQLLRPGGILAISTPDAGSTVARLLGRRWLGWDKVPEHLFFFDRSTLTQLLQNAGFEVVTMRYVPLVVSLGYLTDRLTELTRLPLSRFVSDRGRRRSVRVNPFYDLYVLARVS